MLTVPLFQHVSSDDGCKDIFCFGKLFHDSTIQISKGNLDRNINRKDSLITVFLIKRNLPAKKRKKFESVLHLPDLTPQSAIFGFFDIDPTVYLITNHLLLIFKFHVYNARSIKNVNINILKRKIKKVQETEKNISQTNENKYAKYKKKWKFLEQH